MVEYDDSQKSFYKSNPSQLNLKPPEVQFSHSFDKNQGNNNSSFRNPNQYRPNFRAPSNSRPSSSFQSRGFSQYNPRQRTTSYKPRFTLPPKVNLSTCFQCGKVGHLMNQCYSKMKTCYKCGNVGHISRDCNVNNSEFRQTGNHPKS